MAIGRPLAPLTLSPSEREELLSITRSRSMPQSLATRARIVLLAADGESNTDIAERLGLSKPTVGKYLWKHLPKVRSLLYFCLVTEQWIDTDYTDYFYELHLKKWDIKYPFINFLV